MDMKMTVETRTQMKSLIEQLRAATSETGTIDAGRRANLRIVFGANGVIRAGDEGDVEPVYITTRNISETGLGFISRHAFEPMQKVLVTMDIDGAEVELFATVVHCTSTLGGMMKVGLQFILKDE